MGRYATFNTGVSWKFFFGVQSSLAIKDFGGEAILDTEGGYFLDRLEDDLEEMGEKDENYETAKTALAELKTWVEENEGRQILWADAEEELGKNYWWDHLENEIAHVWSGDDLEVCVSELEGLEDLLFHDTNTPLPWGDKGRNSLLQDYSEETGGSIESRTEDLWDWLESKVPAGMKDGSDETYSHSHYANWLLGMGIWYQLHMCGGGLKAHYEF